MCKKHYRIFIRKDKALNKLRYYPQIKRWWGKWCDLFEWSVLSYKNYESALKCIKEDILKNKVTYFDYKVVKGGKAI